jgi:hypothetical protein
VPDYTVHVVGYTPPFDAVCDINSSSGFQGATHIPLWDANSANRVDAYLLRNATDLYICFRGIGNDPNDFAHVYLDVNNSGGSPTSTDYRLVAEPGNTYGNNGGPGGFLTHWGGANPSGWSAVEGVIGGEFGNWQAEFKINVSLLGSFGKEIGMALTSSDPTSPYYSAWPQSQVPQSSSDLNADLNHWGKISLN